jgi:hypothetical protein
MKISDLVINPPRAVRRPARTKNQNHQDNYMKKRKQLYIFLIFLLSPVVYCILVLFFGPTMYWMPPVHRDKQVKLEDLLIKAEDLPGQWKFDMDPYFDGDYGNKRLQDDNLIESMINIQDTEGFTHYVLRYKNKVVAEYHYKVIYKDMYRVFGSDSEFHKVINVNNIQKLGDRYDVICNEVIGTQEKACDIFIKIDEYIVEINIGINGADISISDLERKVNYYSQLAYSKFVKAGLVEEK